MSVCKWYSSSSLKRKSTEYIFVWNIPVWTHRHTGRTITIKKKSVKHAGYVCGSKAESGVWVGTATAMAWSSQWAGVAPETVILPSKSGKTLLFACNIFSSHVGHLKQFFCNVLLNQRLLWHLQQIGIDAGWWSCCPSLFKSSNLARIASKCCTGFGSCKNKCRLKSPELGFARHKWKLQAFPRSSFLLLPHQRRFPQRIASRSRSRHNCLKWFCLWQGLNNASGTPFSGRSLKRLQHQHQLLKKLDESFSWSCKHSKYSTLLTTKAFDSFNVINRTAKKDRNESNVLLKAGKMCVGITSACDNKIVFPISPLPTSSRGPWPKNIWRMQARPFPSRTRVARFKSLKRGWCRPATSSLPMPKEALLGV